MRYLLFIVSMYACLPCYAMEEEKLLVREMTSPLRSSSEQFLTMQNTQELLPKKSSCCKASCPRILPLWGAALPLALGSIPVGIYGVLKESPTMRYIGFGMDAAAVVIAVCWVVTQYRTLEQERVEILESIESERLSQQLTRLNAFDDSLEEQ